MLLSEARAKTLLFDAGLIASSNANIEGLTAKLQAIALLLSSLFVYHGSKTVPTQTYAFPRNGLKPNPINYTPPEVEMAQFHLLKREFEGCGLSIRDKMSAARLYYRFGSTSLSYISNSLIEVRELHTLLNDYIVTNNPNEFILY